MFLNCFSDFQSIIFSISWYHCLAAQGSSVRGALSCLGVVQNPIGRKKMKEASRRMSMLEHIEWLSNWHLLYLAFATQTPREAERALSSGSGWSSPWPWSINQIQTILWIKYHIIYIIEWYRVYVSNCQDGSMVRAMYRRQSQPRYDDVPNATEEEIQQYPRILATFFQQAMPLCKDFTTLCHCVTGWGDFLEWGWERL